MKEIPKTISVMFMEGQSLDDTIVWADLPGKESWKVPHHTYYHESELIVLKNEINRLEDARDSEIWGIGDANTARQYAETERDILKMQIEELRGILSLNKDEYVKQVGAWKIIQRLEEENEKFKERLSKVKETLDELITANGPFSSHKAQQNAIKVLKEWREE